MVNGGMGETVWGISITGWYKIDRGQGEVKNNIGNGEAK